MSNSIIRIEPLGFPWKTSDPFLFCAYHEDDYPNGNGKMGPDASLSGRSIGQDFAGKDGWNMYHGSTVPGFPAHPHRGFETITIVQKGLVDHADSLGAAGRFGNGDVQWMTAAKGVQHSEMFPLLNDEAPNPFLLFQIWLNLPKRSKFAEPHFKMLWDHTIPVHSVSNGGGTTEVTIVAGTLAGKTAPEPAPDSWAADPDHHVAVWTIKMAPGASFTIPAEAKGLNRSLFYFKGNSVNIGGKNVDVQHSISLNSDVDAVIENGDAESHFLFLQGKPINEPVAQYGPFVMNTQAEIREAMMEFQVNQFGGWPWSKPDQVHDKERGRFALHADGREETPD